MRHWINSEFGAANVMRVPVDGTIADEFTPLLDDLGDKSRFSCVRPKWNSDIQWYSAATEETFALFQSAFDRLQVARHVEPYLDLKHQVRMYTGFIVLRSHCDTPMFHEDWVQCNNEGFTLITPITDGPADFGLTYQKLNGKVADYQYRRGEALIFGDAFWHSTARGQSDVPVALLTFNFGTDKIEHWERLSRTAARQSTLVRRPDGQFEQTGLVSA